MFFLHFSDMHFGIEQAQGKEETEAAIRSNYMNDLTNRICEINRNKKVDFIIITGDIAWKATEDDYILAEKWIRGLLKSCNMSVDQIFLCVGNHDIERETVEELEFPRKQLQANKFLRVERLDKLQMRFEQYINFFNHLGLKEYKIGSKKSPLLGIRDMGDFRVICLNTAWYAKNDDVKDQMWVGADLWEVIKKDVKSGDKKWNIVIMHHPYTSWHEEERSNYMNNINVFNEICKMADIVMSGHTHETCGMNVSIENALVVSSGALYQDKHYPHCFYAYEIDFKSDNYIPKRIRHYYINGIWNCIEETVLIPGRNTNTGGTGTHLNMADVNLQRNVSDSIFTQSNLFCIAGETIRFIPIICSWNRDEDEYYYGDIMVCNKNEIYKMPDDILECFLEMPVPLENIMNNVFEEKVRVDDYSVKIVGGNHPHILTFDFSKAKYKDFLIAKMTMDKQLKCGETVRNKYFNYKQSLITRNLPNVCGVGIFIITSDNKILISESSRNVAVNPECYIYTASGSMNWEGEKTNPFHDVIRECEEETGYSPNIENLKLYSFGIDYDSGYYQFSFYEKSDKTAEEIMRNVSMARDFYIELQNIIAVEFHYKTVWKVIKENHWDETAKANLITLIVKNFSRQIVEKYIDPNRKRKNYRRSIMQEWERRSQREGRLAVLSNRYPAYHIPEISDAYCQKVISFIDDDLSDKNVIEVGGGIGLFTKYFAENANSVTCVDVSNGMIQRNKKFLGEELAKQVNYINCFFQDYQENKHFDILICSLVLIHNADELQEMVKNMKRLSDTIYLFEHVEDGAQVSRYTEPKTKNEYINLFTEYIVEKIDSHMLFTDNIAFIKLVRSGKEFV